MIWVYADSISSRLRFATDFIFAQRKISYRLTDDLNEIQKSDPCLNYSSKERANSLNIYPASLLWETDVSQQKLDKISWGTTECLSFNEIADPIASIFYTLARYEEYLPFEPDGHGRFCASNSILAKHDWLSLPICDVWAEAIIQEIEKTYATPIPIHTEPVRCIPTFDIDNTYAYKYKSGKQLWGAIAKDLLKLNFAQIKLRSSVRSGKIKDPFDTFDFISDLPKKGIQPLVFWHLGDISSFDRNLSWKHRAHQALIQEMARTLSIGIHPSYQSNTVTSKIKMEVQRLETIIGNPVTNSRQHFLKIKFLQTYRNLLATGIEDDYSMGFSDSEGFRLGTARPVSFFDLGKNETSSLTLHPFVYMDGTLNQYKKYSVTEAQRIVQQLAEQVKRYGGDFIFIWHNETIGESGRWKGWKAVFDATLNCFGK